MVGSILRELLLEFALSKVGRRSLLALVFALVLALVVGAVRFANN